MIWKEWNNDYVAEMPYLTPIKVLVDFCFCHLLFVLPLAIKTTMIIKVIIINKIIKRWAVPWATWIQFFLSTLTHLAATSSTRLTLKIVHQDNIDYQNNDNIDFWSILIIIRKAFGVWQLLFPQESFSDGSEVLILNAPQSKVWPHSSWKTGTGGPNGPKSHIKQVLNL